MDQQDNNETDSTGNEQFQFLSFSLADDHYGVDILRVQEIRGWEECRPIPNTPDYIKGVLNLRDRVIPIIDLRIRFGQQGYEYTPTTVIIVLTVMVQDETHIVGIVVDSVSDVLDINRVELKPAPKLGARINTKFIQGMTMIGERMVVLLDTDRLLNPDELAELEQLAE